MTPAALQALCHRLYPSTEMALSYFGITSAEYDAWISGAEPIPLTVSRALRFGRAVPRDASGKVAHTAGPNTKYRLLTPAELFDSVSAAAAAHKMTEQVAYQRAKRGTDGWKLVPLTDEEREAFWETHRAAGRQRKRFRRR